MGRDGGGFRTPQAASHGLFEVAVFLRRAAEPALGLQFRQGDGALQLLQLDDLVRERAALHDAVVEVGVARDAAHLDLAGSLPTADLGDVSDRGHGAGLVDPEALDDRGEQVSAELVILFEGDDLAEEGLADGDDDVGFQGWGRHCDGLRSDLSPVPDGPDIRDAPNADCLHVTFSLDPATTLFPFKRLGWPMMQEAKVE